MEAKAFKGFVPRVLHGSLAQEIDSQVASAKLRFLGRAPAFDRSGAVLEVRSTAPGDSELASLLEPARARIAMNYCVPLVRLIESSSSDPESRDNGL